MYIISVFIVILLETLALIVLRYVIMRDTKYIGSIAGSISIVYVVCIIIATFGIRHYSEEARVNLIPFNAITSLITQLINSASNWGISNIPHELTFMTQGLCNLAGNLLILLPLGYLAPMLFRTIDNCWKAGGLGFIVSATIELLQLITHRGFFDVDDIILNTIGCIVGWICYAKWLREREERS